MALGKRNGPDSLPPIAHAATTPSVAVSVDGRIAEDKRCIDCGYNLRGLKPDGRCPECGGTVAASLRGHELHAASVPWLRTVRRGFGLIKMSILLSLLALVVSIVVEEGWEALNPGTPFPPSTSSVLLVAMSLMTSLLALYGFVLATSVEPRLAQRGEGPSARYWARVLAVSTLALWVMFELLKRLGPKGGWIDQVVMVTPLLLALLAPLAVAAFVQHVIGLLARTAEQKTLKEAKRTRQYVLLAVGLAAVVLLVNAAAPFFRPGTEVADRLLGVGRLARDFTPCVTIVFVLGALQLVWRISRILDRILTVAQE